MRAYWVTFTDGTAGCCDGQSAYDAAQIAEHFTKKKVDDGGNKYEPKGVKPLPYPANPIIWQFLHPIDGRACPPFCHDPKNCAGRSSCPKNYACSE